jgi:adenine-specific DNA-methyltransferase
MDSVFVAGSRALSKLNAQVKERLDNILRKEFTVLVGDANGADKAVQRYLAQCGYKRVIVYCMEECRVNSHC